MDYLLEMPLQIVLFFNKNAGVSSVHTKLLAVQIFIFFAVEIPTINLIIENCPNRPIFLNI